MKRSLQSATSPNFRAIWVIKSKSVIKRWCISIDSDAYYHHYPTFSHHINPRLTSLQHMSSPAPVDLACKSWDGDPIYKHPLLCSNFPSLHNYEENGGTKKLNNASICGVPVRVQPKSQLDNTMFCDWLSVRKRMRVVTVMVMMMAIISYSPCSRLLLLAHKLRRTGTYKNPFLFPLNFPSLHKLQGEWWS